MAEKSSTKPTAPGARSRWLRLVLMAGSMTIGAPRVAVAASPERRASAQEILANVGLSLRDRHDRCSEYDLQAESLDALHSLHRENIHHHTVRINGRERLRSGRDPFEEIVYEHHSTGPRRVAIALGPGAWERRAEIKEGDRIEIDFVDGQGTTHKTFCGRLLRVDRARSKGGGT